MDINAKPNLVLERSTADEDDPATARAHPGLWGIFRA